MKPHHCAASVPRGMPMNPRRMANEHTAADDVDGVYNHRHRERVGGVLHSDKPSCETHRGEGGGRAPDYDGEILRGVGVDCLAWGDGGE